MVFASHGTLLARRSHSSHSLIAGIGAVLHSVIGLAAVLAVSAAASDALTRLSDMTWLLLIKKSGIPLEMRSDSRLALSSEHQSESTRETV